MLPGLYLNASNIHDYATMLLKHHGGTLVFKGPWLSNMKFIATCDPMNLHHISSRSFENYGKGSEFHEVFEILGDGILNADGETWKYSRALLHSLFRQRSFEFFLQETIQEKLESCLLPFLDHISKEGMEVDIQDTFQKFIFDIVSLAILGFDPDCLSIGSPNVALEKAFSEIEASILYRHVVPHFLWKLQKWLQIGEEKKLIKARKIIETFLHEQITSKRKVQRKCNNNKKDEGCSDVLTNIMVQEWEKGQIDDKFLRDTAINLLAAGRDTISAGLCWFIWLVARHPCVEAKIIEEIRSSVRDKKEACTAFGYEKLGKLVYLHAAICETFRLYPPVPINHKCAMKSDTLPSGHHVDSNTMILSAIYPMGRMKEVWGQDCLEFKPERWISDTGEIVPVPSYKFMTFNAGPRSCLGKNMSFIKMKMVAAAILCNYHVQVVEGHPVSPCASVVLHMKHGLKVRVTKRCN
ncbi:hypothetical protein L6164_028915 [Bauhinia variegata]|uniref:Uncharacterized protein n=1 Tax=Bauhinia variegata TaxID=167791 RepID=A0ACB9L7Q4_BAUVA|nr:hypothetical protein L6164_028915 [Bauhinia variegata]